MNHYKSNQFLTKLIFLIGMMIMAGCGKPGPSLDETIAQANEHLEAGDVEQAISLLDNLYKKHPKHIGLLETLAFAQADIGNHHLAAFYFEEVVKIDPGKQQFLIYAAQSHVQSGDVAIAVTKYRKYLKKQPKESRIWKILGELLVKQGDQIAAIDAFKESYQIRPDEIVALNLGAAYADTHLAVEAEFWFQIVMEFESDSMPQALLGLLDVAMIQRNYMIADKIVERLDTEHKGTLDNSPLAHVRQDINTWQKSQKTMVRKLEVVNRKALKQRKIDAISKAKAKKEVRAKAKAKKIADAKAKAWAKTKADMDAKAKAEALSKAKAEALSKAKAKAKARAKNKALAQAKAKAEAKARTAKAKKQAKESAMALAKAQAKAKAEAMAEAKAKAQAEAEARAKVEKEAKALAKAKKVATAIKEAEEKARVLSLAKSKAEREAQIKAKKRAEAVAKAIVEKKALTKAKVEAATKARAEKEALAKAKADVAAKALAEKKALAVAKAEADARAKAEALEQARVKEEARAKADALALATANAKAKAAAEAVAQAKARERKLKKEQYMALPPAERFNQSMTAAKTLNDAGDYKGAVEKYWEALKVDDSKAETWHTIAKTQLSDNRTRWAETTSLEAIRRDPGNVSYTLLYLKAAQHNHQAERFLEELIKARVKFPDSPDIMLALARGYDKIKNNARNASMLYREFLEKAPNHPSRDDAQAELNALSQR